MSQHLPQQGGQTDVTCCAQQCCMMLRLFDRGFWLMNSWLTLNGIKTVCFFCFITTKINNVRQTRILRKPYTCLTYESQRQSWAFKYLLTALSNQAMKFKKSIFQEAGSSYFFVIWMMFCKSWTSWGNSVPFSIYGSVANLVHNLSKIQWPFYFISHRRNPF